MLENYKASYDAHVIGKLKAAGGGVCRAHEYGRVCNGWVYGKIQHSGRQKIHTTQRACRAARLAAPAAAVAGGRRACLWHSAPILEAPFASPAALCGIVRTEANIRCCVASWRYGYGVFASIEIGTFGKI